MGTITKTQGASGITVTEDKTGDRLPDGSAAPGTVVSTNAVNASSQGAGATSGKRWTLTGSGWSLA